MWVDSRALADGTLVDSDLCIVGGGAAGIAIAREWIGAGRSVTLLESGGLEPDAKTQALYRGPASGNVLADPDTYLTRSRLRYFGGSTNHWGGHCRPMDVLDFEARPWVEESGWPFGRETLEPYYGRARAVVELPARAGDASFGRKDPPLLEAPTAMGQALIQFSPPTRFGQRYLDEIDEASNVTLYLNANALELVAAPEGGAVREVRVGCLEGPRWSIRARVFVLAAGGVENARLMLASRGQRPDGLGNGRDLVGRYFMDHLALPEAGRAIVTLPFSHMRRYRPARRRHGRSLALVTTSELAQREHRLLGFSARLRRIEPGELEPEDAALLRTVHGFDRLDRPPDTDDVFAARLEAIAEPSPNRESRVTLSDEKDALGAPRAQLSWQVRPSDYASLHRSLELLASELGRQARGRAGSNLDSTPRTLGWSHHMGTTRMHADPARGVVDTECRAHDVSNLWIAGSSVFPTAGSEGTTTLTLLALALRLSDRLKRELQT